MDRKDWKFGKTNINILTAGIVLGKIAIPFILITLPQSTKRGKSHSKHRIPIMKHAFKILAPEGISSLAMDREFNGKEWLK